ncbi:MAG: LruC domain-containing protein [Candidatus Cloacimonetes bacterium]|nr:LruC domain-containing protein [Candidatus Cloacimonadota bacterium]
MRVLLLFFISLTLILASCSLYDTKSDNESIKDLQIPDDFDFSMERNVELLIEMNNSSGLPITGVVYEIFSVGFNDEHKFLLSSRTDAEGIINENLLLPSYVQKLFISGYMNEMELEIINGTASYVFSPEGGQRGNGEFTAPSPNRNFSYIDGMSYDPDGVPSPMELIGIEPELMARVGTSLPEHDNIPLSHPQYLADGVQTNFVFTDSADVWITFVSEGASFLNALGYYTYDTATGPPADPASLDLTLVFPNCSFVESGGAMESGMQVYLGRFAGGTSMGWFLVKDGWISGGNVSEDSLRYYSENSYNPEPAPNNQHTVLLYDSEFEAFVMGFEDKLRYVGDNDFNDAVFLANANPISNVDITGVPPIDIPPDTDGDGVSDPIDEYPEDPERAFDVYYPNQDDFATLVFEDLWPVYGDYDMNDFVLDYQYHVVTNADNEFKDINSQFTLRAIGARYDNGFALQLPFLQNNLTLNGNSTNLLVMIQDLNYATIDIFQHTTWMTGQPEQAPYNTENDDIHREPIDFFVNVTVLDPIPTEDLAFSFPFNPFIYQEGVYGHEIHLMNYPPTSRADLSLLGTGDDASDPNNDQYYLSATNLPWGLNMPQSWAYPEEKNSIVDTYYHFADWAESGGTLYPDWYLNTPENVNQALLYINP